VDDDAGGFLPVKQAEHMIEDTSALFSRRFFLLEPLRYFEIMSPGVGINGATLLLER
jgi:hypothetical protein